MADLGPGEWERYVCLEAGAVGSAVRVLPGDTFAAGQTLSSSCAAATEAGNWPSLLEIARASRSRYAPRHAHAAALLALLGEENDVAPAHRRRQLEVQPGLGLQAARAHRQHQRLRHRQVSHSPTTWAEPACLPGPHTRAPSPLPSPPRSLARARAPTLPRSLAPSLASPHGLHTATHLRTPRHGP
eukprot:scaffold13034_cov54-Phaeocystis_antarctica.AAC.2